mgnify:CR=1 FL=1
MSLRRAHDVDAEYANRSAHQVDTPENYGDWRQYAFSDAPELVDDLADLDVITPLAGVPTV